MNLRKVRDRLEKDYGFLISRSSLLLALYKELDLTTAVIRTNKIPLTTDRDKPKTAIYHSVDINYHPPNDNQHRTHKVVV